MEIKYEQIKFTSMEVGGSFHGSRHNFPLLVVDVKASITRVWMGPGWTVGLRRLLRRVAFISPSCGREQGIKGDQIRMGSGPGGIRPGWDASRDGSRSTSTKVFGSSPGSKHRCSRLPRKLV